MTAISGADIGTFPAFRIDCSSTPSSWIARNGAPWPDVPERFGKYDTAYQRCNRWAKSGVLARVMLLNSNYRSQASANSTPSFA
jgi:transposase